MNDAQIIKDANDKEVDFKNKNTIAFYKLCTKNVRCWIRKSIASIIEYE